VGDKAAFFGKKYRRNTLCKCRVVSTVNEYQGCLEIQEHRDLIVLAFK